MIIELNKDFLKEYKDNAWKGFSTKELISIAGAGAVTVIVDVLLYKVANIDIATGVYIALPVAFPVLLIGFFKFQGFLSVPELLKEALYYTKTKELLYDSHEGIEKDSYIRLSYEPLDDQNGAKTNKKSKGVRKTQRLGSCGIMYMPKKELKQRVKVKKKLKKLRELEEKMVPWDKRLSEEEKKKVLRKSRVKTISFWRFKNKAKGKGKDKALTAEDLAAKEQSQELSS